MNATPLWTSQDAVAATGGRVVTPWKATGVSIDTRTLNAGDLFVALRGPNFDGHAFVAAALKAGAAAVVVDHVPADVPANAPLLIVADTQKALEDLGQFARARTKAKVLAVTGSVGKTGTKEMMAAGLRCQGATFATVGNLNNHWGVPLSLARMPADTAYAVFELGMNHAGEIGPLSRMVRPDVSIITTIEAVHLEHFSGVEAIADAKAEIFEGMPPTGIAILNRDNPQYARLADGARRAGLAQVWSFGLHDDADAQLATHTLYDDSSAVTADIRGERIDYRLQIPGRHIVLNSLGVLAAIMAAGADVHAAAAELMRLAPLKGRGAKRTVALPHGSFALIDDSYNASPVAMKAAFQVLAQQQPGVNGRRVAVLGDMLELGSQSDALHAGLATHLVVSGIGTVHCCGPHMRALYEQLPVSLRGHHATDSTALAPLVAQSVRTGDVVLVKGSAGSRMSRVVEALTALEPAGSTKTKMAEKV